MPKLEPDKALIEAALAAMRPFVRRMLQRGITFGQFENRLRDLFVDVAERDIVSSDGRQTDSRISALTGLNRKEIRRIRREEEGRPASKSFSRNLAATVVSRWVGDRAATTATGRPLPIPYDAKRGPSFSKFAAATTNDMGPRALLQVLIDAGSAEIRKGGMVVLKRSAYVPEAGRPEALAMLADDPPELIETMLHNVLGEGDGPRLQQKLAYDNIGSEGLKQLSDKLRREAERFLRSADKALLRHDRDRNPRAAGGERLYAGVGVYYFESRPTVVDAREPGGEDAADQEDEGDE